MRSLRAFGLAAAMIVTGAAAHAQTGVYVGFGGPAHVYASAYVPPCPGPGYAWVAGYYPGGYWVPGRWEFRRDCAVRRDSDARFYNRDHYRDYDRDRDAYRDRHEDRDHRDHDKDRDRHEGYRR